MAGSWQITVGDKTAWVDSKVEERFLQWIEANGFSNRWERPSVGIHARGKNYTPDIYLMIEYAGKSHRAVVEVKSVLDDWTYGFNDYISGRMRRAARVYSSTMLLLFVDKTQTWYRVNSRTGQLTKFGIPTPGRITIDRAYRPLTVRAKSVYGHRYEQRLDSFIAKTVLNFMADLLGSTIKALFVTPKPRRRPGRRKRQY